MARKISQPAARRPRPHSEEVIENFFLGVLLFFLAVLVFYPAFHAGFIWDDDQLLTANPQVHSPGGWWTLWLKPETADYFPLTSSTLWLEWRIWGLNANGYHITNVFLHATVTVLTWQTLKRLRVPGAWIAAAIFAVHPVCVESVAWISERKNTISQIFFLLSIIHYVRFEEKGRAWRYAAAILCFTLSLLAKTSVVMLPFILLLLAWWRYRELEPLRSSYELEQNPIERRILWIAIPLGAAIAGALAAWFGWQVIGAQPLFSAFAKAIGQVPGAIVFGLIAAAYGAVVARKLDGALKRHPYEDLALQAGVIAIAILGAAAGALLGSHLFASKMLGLILGGLLLGALLAGLGVAALRQVEKIRLNSLAGFEFIRTIPFFDVALLLGVVTIYFQYGRAIGGEVIPIGNLWQRTISACFAAGFYLYSALWPFNIIEIYPQWHRAFFPPAPEAIPYWKQVIPGILIGGLLFYCWKRRTESWARALLAGLGTYFIAMLPALGFLTMSYMRLTLVADHFQYISIVAVIALVVAAGASRSLNPLCLGLAALFFAVVSFLNWGETQDNHIEQLLWIIGPIALAVIPRQEDLWKWAWGAFLAGVLLSCSIVSFFQTEIYHDEESLWSATLDKNPNTWQGHNHLGAALYMRGDIKDAFPHFAMAVKLKPENPESHNNLGLALSYFGMKDEAIHQYEIAVSIKDDSSMETNLANAYEEVNRFNDAIRAYKHAIELNPDNPSAHCNMGYALMQQGRIDEAIEQFMKTMELDRTMPQGQRDLREALRLKGVNPEAPVISGTYSFDVHKALDLLKNAPPLPPPDGPPQ